MILKGHLNQCREKFSGSSSKWIILSAQPKKFQTHHWDAIGSGSQCNQHELSLQRLRPQCCWHRALFHSQNSEQEKRILLANVGDWEPVMLSSLNGKTYHFLTSPENILDVLVDQPVGQWTLPITTKSVTGECTAINRSHLLHHFISTSPFYKCKSSHEYTELSKPICESINRDWLIFPQYRYAVSQLFAGAILLEQSSAILLNSVEPYGRLKSTDAHYERRIATAIHLTSYPEKETKYGWITVIKKYKKTTPRS
ncbi:hypothetical protein BD770DRAFT_423205 [Pilaira anomala]|nr:hypothetical protein BD770DRAFT_423205 [Pilaira anomala]